MQELDKQLQNSSTRRKSSTPVEYIYMYMCSKMDIYSNFTNSNTNSYGIMNCNCCPYGYHIDLDFVRFCEFFSQSEADKTGSIKRRKDRRKQRQSIEVLLGLDGPQEFVENYQPIQEHEPNVREKHQPSSKYGFKDGFDDAVTDFENTFERSRIKGINLPDVTAVSYSENIRRINSDSSVSSASGSSMTVAHTTNDGHNQQDFDNISIESCGLSPMALQNIRDQMVLSLERTKQLEDQMKMIPELKEQLTITKEENRRLQLELRREQQNSQNSYFSRFDNRSRSQSFTTIDNMDSPKKTAPPPPPRKDFGVMCGVLTRNIGVGHQNPNTKSVSTTTLNDFQNSQIKNKAARGTQTIISKVKNDSANQTLEVKKRLIDQESQTLRQEKNSHDVGIYVKPFVSEFAVQKNVDTMSIGVSEDTTNSVLCEKCNFTSSISLASLNVPRSKSFNLGDDKLNLSRVKTVGCQYEPSNISRSIQASTISHSKSSQHEIKHAEKQTQFEKTTVTKTTDTKDLDIPKKHIACQAKLENHTKDIACETESSSDKQLCNICQVKFKDDAAKKDNNVPSRIPRPQLPTTPTENRKFRRQDTYTKLYTSPTEKGSLSSPRLSGLDLSPKSASSESPNPLNFKFPDSTQNGSTITKVESTLSSSETNTHHHHHHQVKKKAVPSKEMQGAMKVLNDALLKNPSKVVKNPTAINIVQQEWFKVSSLVTANPLTVEDYLDAFEDMSALLLQYIVNMTDASGNTAMHYAVSHGNFDVVSILLDSKVCDINKANKTGYTSVMLVSLAEVKSETHADVVRRLFQLADVNIRAKQHGQTALMLAVSHGRLDMVQMLLEAGADINIQDEDGSTALMCAAEHGHIEIVKHFLSHPDCDSTITDVDGSTALTIAMEAGHRTVGVLLYTHERNHQKTHGIKIKRTKSSSPKIPSSPLPIRSSHRALTDTKTSK